MRIPPDSRIVCKYSPRALPVPFAGEKRFRAVSQLADRNFGRYDRIESFHSEMKGSDPAIRKLCGLIVPIVLMICALLPAGAAASEESGGASEPAPDVKIVAGGSPLIADDPVIVADDRLFVPIAPLAERFGGTVEWNGETQTATLRTAHHDLVEFAIDMPVVRFNENEYAMDVAPFIHNERTYVPLRHAAEFLHTRVEWDAETNTAFLEEVPLYAIGEGESLAGVAERFGTTLRLLMERNGLSSTLLNPGFLLKIVIPEVMAENSARMEETAPGYGEDLLLLAKIIAIEAGYEPYEGKLAVGSVIMNRVASERFPGTIREVIFQPGQFPPATSGKLEDIEPDEESLRAAEAVLNGENNVEGALYFYNPAVSKGAFWKTRSLVKEIGHHRFVK